jgi:hypothetical protein
MLPKTSESNSHGGKQRYFGAVDWGVEDDYTVLTVLDSAGNMVFIDRWRQLDWTVIIDKIVSVLKAFGDVTVLAETNGIGNMPTKELKSRWPLTRAFSTTAVTKPKIIEGMMYSIRNGRLKVFDLPWVLSELDNFGMVYNPTTNKVAYKAIKGHDDSVMSIAMANSLITEQSTLTIPGGAHNYNPKSINSMNYINSLNNRR